MYDKSLELTHNNKVIILEVFIFVSGLFVSISIHQQYVGQSLLFSQRLTRAENLGIKLEKKVL